MAASADDYAGQQQQPGSQEPRPAGGPDPAFVPPPPPARAEEADGWDALLADPSWLNRPPAVGEDPGALTLADERTLRPGGGIRPARGSAARSESGPSYGIDRPHIELVNLTVRVQGRTLYENVNIAIQRGDVVLLVGGSGTGKSVLIKLLLGLITPETPGFEITGKILIGGVNVLRPGGSAAIRKQIGIVFQDYALFDELSPTANLAFAFDHSPGQPSQAERDRVTRNLVDTLSLNLYTPVSRMSGGERRRLAIARTLAYDPGLVLFDEPTTGLDPLNSERVADLIGQASGKFAKTCIVVTHDYEYLHSVADRVLLLDPGIRSLVELPIREATVETVKEKLESIRPAAAPDRSWMGDWARKTAGFFISTSHVMEAAVRIPLQLLSWPFTTGLAIAGVMIVAWAMLHGMGTAAASSPGTFTGLIATFALATSVWLAADLRRSLRVFSRNLLILAATIGGAHLLLHGFVSYALARNMVSSVEMLQTVSATQIAGSQASWLIATAVPAIFLLLRLMRARGTAMMLTIGSALTVGGFALVAAFNAFGGGDGLVATYEIPVPAWGDAPITFDFFSPAVLLVFLAVAAIVAGVRAPWTVTRQRWGAHYFGHYFRVVAFSTALPYLLAAGMITGFVGTFFLYRYFPFRSFTEPLLVDDLLHAIGFILFRVLIPLTASVLIAARSGAAVSADVGNRVYAHQSDALRTFSAKPGDYWGQNILWAFLLGGPLLIVVAFLGASVASLAAFIVTHPESTPSFWYANYTNELLTAGSIWPRDMEWWIAKVLICSAGTSVIATSLAMKPKESSVSVSQSITRTILWSTLFVLAVHLVFAFFEFRELGAPVQRR